MKHGNGLLKRLLACTLAVCTCTAFMASCGSGDSSSDASSSAETSAPEADSSVAETTTAAEESEPEPVTPIDVEQGATDEMLERAYLYNGDLSRLAAVR